MTDDCAEKKTHQAEEILIKNYGENGVECIK